MVDHLVGPLDLDIHYPIRHTLSKKQNEKPIDILKKRLAKGEITKEEYEESKKILESDK